MAQERVQKILAQAGITSRRKAEKLISDSLVTINGKIAQLGDKAEWGKDAIKVEGKLLLQKESPVYLAFNKPRGVISMVGDPEGRPSLAEYLSYVKSRVFPVGRLDFNSEGLILLTNDGEFAEKVQKSPEIARVYHVKVKGHPGADVIHDLERGAKIEGKVIQPHSVRLVRDFQNKALIELVFVGGGAVDVRALIDRKRLLFERITRVAIGHLGLREMKPGEFRYLQASQVEALLKQPELGLRKVEAESEKVAPRLKREQREKAAAESSRSILPRPRPTSGKGKKPDFLPRPRSQSAGARPEGFAPRKPRGNGPTGFSKFPSRSTRPSPPLPKPRSSASGPQSPRTEGRSSPPFPKNKFKSERKPSLNSRSGPRQSGWGAPAGRNAGGPAPRPGVRRRRDFGREK